MTIEVTQDFAVLGHGLTAATSHRRRASPPPRLSAAAPRRRRASRPPRLTAAASLVEMTVVHSISRAVRRIGRCDDARNASTHIVMVTYMPGIRVSEFMSQSERRVEMIASA
jgi:hypothetical protein